MGATLNTQGPSRGRRARRRYRPLAEINVTPFVDVMLVLLIVFMVTAPLLVPGVSVNMPQTNARALPDDKDPIAITLDHNGAIFLQDSELTVNELVPRLLAIGQNRTDMVIYVRADKALNYGTVMQLLGTLNQAGFSKVALQSERR